MTAQIDETENCLVAIQSILRATKDGELWWSMDPWLPTLLENMALRDRERYQDEPRIHLLSQPIYRVAQNDAFSFDCLRFP